MPSPFPGMDPYLEQPQLWPEFHNRLLVAIDYRQPPVPPLSVLDAAWAQD